LEQQNTPTDQSTPSDSTQPHVGATHPLIEGVHPSTGIERDSTIILASSMSGHTCFHNLDHSDSDKETTNLAELPVMEFSQINVVIVSSISVPKNSSWWIDVHKGKEGKTHDKF